MGSGILIAKAGDLMDELAAAYGSALSVLGSKPHIIPCPVTQVSQVAPLRSEVVSGLCCGLLKKVSCNQRKQVRCLRSECENVLEILASSGPFS